jgi:hypothetical protein
MKKITGAFIIFISLFFGTSIIDASGSQLIIINKGTNQLAFFEDGKLISTFRVATGRSNSLTPEGTFKIVNKIKNRPYYKDKIPGGHPSNPLGDRWLGLDARGTYGTTYAIHGNSNPASIGTYASAGCVRMHDEEVRWLFDRINLYATVVITNSSKSFDAIAAANNYVPYSKLQAVTVDKVSPEPEKTSVTVTAKTTNKITSHYRFLVFDGTEWKTVQDFSISNQLNWQPEKAGSYQVKVQVKSTSSDKAFDDEKVIPYDVFIPAAIQLVEAEKESPLPTNTSIALSTVTNSETANHVKYSIHDGVNWTTLQDYSDTMTFNWKPTKPGTYKIKVQTKHKLSQNEFDHEEELSYTIFEPATLTTVTTDVVSPQPIDSAISITSLSNNDSTNLFKILLYDAEKWSTIQDYSANTNLAWKPKSSGTYKIKVQAKHKLSKEEFDTEEVLDYVVYEPAILHGLSTNMKSIQLINNDVKITATAVNNQDLEYRFSVFNGSEWEMVQSYSPSNELHWKPTEPGFYKVKIEIKHKLSNEEYDDVHEVPYIIYKTAATQAVLPASTPLRRNGTFTIKGFKRRRE